TSACRINSVN
nr:cysteine protease, Der f I allergen [Dermatophagoides farinae=mite, Peptide Partial, 10 aa] [Dermatophagoides farinae]